MGLGNRTPAPIKYVENRLWRVVIDVATTSRPLTDVVKDGLRDIQGIISSYPDGSQLEPRWFRAGRFNFDLSAHVAGSNWFIHVDTNTGKAAASSALLREEEEESEEEDELLNEENQSEDDHGKAEVIIESFAMAFSGLAALEDRNTATVPSPKPFKRRPHTDYSAPSTPPPAYAKECTPAPSTVGYLRGGAPIAPFSIGQSSIAQSSESDPVSPSVVAGRTGAVLREEESGEDEDPVNKRLADVNMEDDSSRNEGSTGEGNDVDMGIDTENEHDSSQDVAMEGEQSSSVHVDMGASAGTEHDDSPGVREEGDQSGSMDVDMEVSTRNEHNDNQDEGTPESSPRKKLPSLAGSKSEAHSGEKRKNPNRAAKSETKHEPPPPPRPKPKRKPKPKPKPKPIPGLKPKPRAQSPELVERNYFEEFEFGAISRTADMIDLTQDIVCHSSPYKGIIC